MGTHRDNTNYFSNPEIDPKTLEDYVRRVIRSGTERKKIASHIDTLRVIMENPNLPKTAILHTLSMIFILQLPVKGLKLYISLEDYNSVINKQVLEKEFDRVEDSPGNIVWYTTYQAVLRKWHIIEEPYNYELLICLLRNKALDLWCIEDPRFFSIKKLISLDPTTEIDNIKLLFQIT